MAKITRKNGKSYNKHGEVSVINNPRDKDPLSLKDKMKGATAGVKSEKGQKHNRNLSKLKHGTKARADYYRRHKLKADSTTTRAKAKPRVKATAAKKITATPVKRKPQTLAATKPKGVKVAAPKKKLSLAERLRAKKQNRRADRAAKYEAKGKAALKSGDKKAALKYRRKMDKTTAKYRKTATKSTKTKAKSKPRARKGAVIRGRR